MTMEHNKPSTGASRGEPLRQSVLDAAERLLRDGKAAFSMRDLAAEAGVSFATPFNQFGSKAAIMQALSGRRIANMAARFAGAVRPTDAAERVLLAIGIGVEVMLEEPEVNRAVMGWLGTADLAPSRVLAQSSELWRAALGEGEGLSVSSREAAVRDLPKVLAFLFRGVLSFWTAGEIADADLATAARDAAQTVLSGYRASPHP